MKQRTIWQKLKSTKLWCVFAAIAFGVAVAFGADSESLEKIIGAVTAMMTTMTYIITEGKIDASASGEQNHED